MDTVDTPSHLPNRAARRDAAQRARKLGAIGSGAMLATGAAGAAVSLTAGTAGAATTFTVTAPVDIGLPVAGSLTKAIEDANSTAGQDVIDFAIPGPTLIVTADLPQITEEVLITGPGASALTIDLASNCGFHFYALPSGSSTVSGLTISNGASFGCNADDSGGAISNFLSDADLRVENSVFTGNYAFNDGGALVCYAGYSGGSYRGYADVTIVDSWFTGNASYESGGAIYSRCYGDVVITGSHFTSNESLDDDGGGVYVDNYGDLTIGSSTFTTNRADGDGGALETEGFGKLTVTNSTFTDNVAGFGGGGIDGENYSDILISNSTFTGNDAGRGAGGGIYTFAAGVTTISNSTFSNNRAGSWGGGLYSTYTSGGVAIVQSTFTGNHADEEAGAISMYGADLTIVQSTISGNTSGGGIGGVSFYQESTNITGTGARAAQRAAARAAEDETSPRDHGAEHRKRPDRQGGGVGARSEATNTITGSIISGNSASTPASKTDVGTNLPIAVTSDHSLLGIVDPQIVLADAGGTITGVTNPGLAPLADNGGTTQTMAILPGSPAINAGPAAGTVGASTVSATAAAAPPVGPYDQRGAGFPRVRNGRIDIGAFEYFIVPKFTG